MESTGFNDDGDYSAAVVEERKNAATERRARVKKAFLRICTLESTPLKVSIGFIT